MIKNLYEIFDEFEAATTKEEQIRILRENKSKHLLEFFNNVFDPNIHFYVNQFPKEYIKPDTLPGIRWAGIESEIRKAYLFQKGNPTADSLTEQKRTQLLCQLLESFEPREADFFVRMLTKNLRIPNLTLPLIREAYERS
jgi:hypothetical protein